MITKSSSQVCEEEIEEKIAKNEYELFPSMNTTIIE